MKYTIVPAQVTTVEDRIAGSLGMSQLLLLTAPVFLDSLLYIVMPPYMHFALYKVALMVVILSLCCLSAIRIKGKILILWLVVICRYNLRPRFYLFNKNSLAGREQHEVRPEIETEQAETQETARPKRIPELPLPDKVRLEALLASAEANFAFIRKKGGLDVTFNKVKD